MLSELAQFKTVEEAAQFAAGNWKHWENFVWFGDTDVDEPGNVYLVYTTCFVSGSEYPNQNQIHAIVGKLLWPYFDPPGLPGVDLANGFVSSFCGDRDLLRGFQVRVYRHGQITPAFNDLYYLTKDLQRIGAFDEETDESLKFHVSKEPPPE